MSSPWEVLVAVAQRNGLDALVLCGHVTSAHDVDPAGPQWAAQCEAAAACLHGHGQALAGELARAEADVTTQHLRPALEAAGLDPAQHHARFDTTPVRQLDPAADGGAP